jgi:hypothetical protein
MHLKRNKTVLSPLGLFQASKIKNRSAGLLGIRRNGYFLSLALCVQLKETLTRSRTVVRKFKKPKASSHPPVISSESPTSSEIPVQAISLDVLQTPTVQYPFPVGYFNPCQAIQVNQGTNFIQYSPQVFSIPQAAPEAFNPPILIYFIN